jgi:hypothetical protein
MKSVLFPTILLLCAGGVCFADNDTDVIEYYGATFRIPAPDGYERFDKTYPQLAEPIRRAVSLSSDLLAAYAKAQEILDRDGGRLTHFKTLYHVTENTDLRSVDVTQELFDQIKSQLKNKNATPDFQGMADKAAEAVNDYLQKEQSPTDAIKLQGPHMIGTFDERPNSIGVLVISRVKLTTNGATEDFSELVAMAFVNVKERLILLSCSGEYTDAATITAVKAKLTTWRDQVISLNSEHP